MCPECGCPSLIIECSDDEEPRYYCVHCGRECTHEDYLAGEIDDDLILLYLKGE